MTFTIDNENNITAYGRGEQMPAFDDFAGDGLKQFTSEKELERVVLASERPGERLIEIWNSLAGVAPFDDLKPVRKFTDRKTAIARIWKAIQKLAPATTEAAKKEQRSSKPKPAAKKEKVARQPKPAAEAKAPREGTAKAKVIGMLQRKGGATLQEIMETTGWQPHTVRGFISTLGKKTGLVINRTRRESDQARVYEAQ